MQVKTLSKSRTLKLCVEDVHFFTEADCKIFESQADCVEARKARTWLASFPCSGSTWMRVLMHQLTGIHTGSLYQDGDLRKIGMKGEGHWDPSKVIMVKTHYPDFDTNGELEAPRAVVLMRSPLDAALSWASYDLAVVQGASMPHATEVDPAALRHRFDEKRDWYLTKWKDFASYWLGLDEKDSYVGKTLVVHYEDLVANTSAVLTQEVLPFVGILPEAVHPCLECAVSAKIPGVYREHTYTFPFTAMDKEAVMRIIGRIILKRAGYGEHVTFGGI